jgi:Cu-Zn family superoxide dismutase
MRLRLRRQTITLALAAGCVGTFTVMTLRAQEPRPRGELGKMKMMAANPVTKAVAVLHATKSGRNASGIVTFTKVEGGVRVQGEVTGLDPGLHGFHIHEFGDCSSPDAMSAGGHFNPTGAQHAGTEVARRHIGDLGNIEANNRGVAKFDITDPHLTFAGMTSILGRGLIVHEKADDLKTQPTGAAGGRVACGVIGVAKGS